MEKNDKRISEFELPQEIIHHIQSFMDGREAAQTTLLSKQWHGAWSTRPNLNFNQHHFDKNEFEEFTKKTMQRYEDRNLYIHSFRLGITRFEDYSLAAIFIVKAIKLGATEIEIKFWTSSSPKPFVLADEVFQSQTLTRLSINGCCTLGLEMRMKKEVITTRSNLKSLKLSRVYDVDQNTIRDLIEELTLNDLRPCFDLGALIKLHKLKYLRLDGIEKRLFRSDLWPKFACLKELVLIIYCYSNYKDIIRICSTSLERITIRAYTRNVNVELDVPNIRMFRFKGNHMPRIELKTTAREWETHICITFRLYDNDTIVLWFKSLNQLVKMFGQSRLSLCINLWLGKGDGDGYVEDGLDVPALENLTINGCYTMSPSFFGSFTSELSP